VELEGKDCPSCGLGGLDEITNCVCSCGGWVLGGMYLED
jgi:hypothetical protein